MADLSVVERHRLDLFHLTTAVSRDLSGFLYQVRDLPVDEVRDLLIQVIPDLVDPYLTAAGELAATWYEDLRAEVAARAFYASGDTPSVQRLQANAMARWAVDPLATDDDMAATLRRLAGAAARMVYDASRGVVEGNVVRDPVRVGFQRMARPGCCAFCGMLASRGPEYRSESAAGGVVGRGADVASSFRADGSRKAGGLAGGVKARGSKGLGNRFHDDCHCVVMPVFFGTEMAELARAEEDKFTSLYEQAAGAAESSGTKALLAAWRATNGTK